jgi:hypothetical protein
MYLRPVLGEALVNCGRQGWLCTIASFGGALVEPTNSLPSSVVEFKIDLGSDLFVPVWIDKRDYRRVKLSHGGNLAIAVETATINGSRTPMVFRGIRQGNTCSFVPCFMEKTGALAYAVSSLA